MTRKKTPCSGCGMCEPIAIDCANSGNCLKQHWEYPEEQGDPTLPPAPDPRDVPYGICF